MIDAKQDTLPIPKSDLNLSGDAEPQTEPVLEPQSPDSQLSEPRFSEPDLPTPPTSTAELRVDGWSLQHNHAGDTCGRCDARPSLLHIGRRLVTGGWEDVPGNRLCLQCFGTVMAQRSTTQSMGGDRAPSEPDLT